MKTEIRPDACEFAIAQIDDGNVFESFAQQFTSAVMGHDFIPVGGMKDRGVDGLKHIYQRSSLRRWIYQMSIDKNPRAKLRQTAKALSKNEIEYDCLYYITNIKVKDKDVLSSQFFEDFQKPVHIFDLAWFSSNINANSGTQNAFNLFTSHHLHTFQKPGAVHTVSDLVTDPRLFVFLRQQWETSSGKDLRDILADTLILYSLEGTDPDKDVLKTRRQILEDINTYIHFDPKHLVNAIDERLAVLSTKPRRIRYHKKPPGYCLPYTTRCEIRDRNLTDAALQDSFRATAQERLENYLGSVAVSNGVKLLEDVFHKLFYRQGLEFSAFVLRGENQQAIEQNLGDIISEVLQLNNIPSTSREKVAAALHVTIRDIVYNGNTEQKQFLAKLANTYMMLFLLQVDPKIASYFQSMANQLRIYVDNSIIIPALSEYFLADENRRHWNLLKRARQAGVELIVEDGIIDELLAHFKMIDGIYHDEYCDCEGVYLSDEMLALYIDHIMIRAYFYAKRRTQVRTWPEFLDQFIDPSLGATSRDNLVTFLREEFGIRFIAASEAEHLVPKNDFRMLYRRLKNDKMNPQRARTDARLILRIYYERIHFREDDHSGLLGYKTWWLSKDVLTQRAVVDVFGNKFSHSCYIRPDFLHNFICLAPNLQDVNEAFQAIFPSLIGVNISYHVDSEIIAVVHRKIKEHGERKPARVVAILRDLTDRLKSDPDFNSPNKVVHYLDDKLAEASVQPLD